MVAMKFLLADASISQGRIRLLISWAANLTIQLLTKDNKSESCGIQKEGSSHHFKANLAFKILAFCHRMERSKQKKKTKLKQNSTAQLQTLLATSTDDWKYKGCWKHPCLESWGFPAGEGRESTNHAAHHQHKDVYASSGIATREGEECKGGYGEQGALADPHL